MDLCTEAAALAWFLEEPQAVVDGYLRQGAEVAEHARSVLSTPVRYGTVFGWLQASLLAGDERLLQLVTRTALDPGQLEPTEPIDVAAPLLPMTAALAVGDDRAAASHAADMRHRAGLPSTSAEELRRTYRLPDMADAVLARDQAALDDACTDRSAASTRHWRRSVEDRRHPDGLLDPYAGLVAATAPRHGLTPPDVPDLPRGLMPGPHRTTL